MQTDTQYVEPDLPVQIIRFSLSPITYDELTKLLSAESTNAEGVDGISARYYSLSLNVLLPVFLKIINRSLTTSTFPDVWKKSLIIPIPKNNNHTCPKDFRPISLLCSLS